ncbi:glycosyltransferase involved in cell wall biosynthesis [Georgenia soli]|uniref:Glycosyltransferase involved in cell wall biosynthesis n=1 Tax=Georgenia soli TaxID=638953 RepID=A0A2A9EJW7_9MICO|nr:glycosyltransferase family 4 protein [Georgenia soli]PFG39103.1 glycosyltransferase involved in cell wall biosynthesis [Georgenia soli]
MASVLDAVGRATTSPGASRPGASRPGASRPGASRPGASRPRLLLAVTGARSFGLMHGFPQYLERAGWAVHLVSDPGAELDDLGPLVSGTHAVPMRRDPSPAADLRALVAWVRLLRRLRPDAVLAATPKAALLGLVAARLTGVPVRVYDLWGLRLETTTGLLRRVLTLTETLTARAATGVLAVSPSLAAEFTGAGLAGSRPVDILGRGSSSGVDAGHFDPSLVPPAEVARARREAGLEPGRLVVGYVGRITPDKGVGTLDAAMRILSQDGVPACLLVVGEADVAGYAPFTAPHVHRVGRVEDPRPYYRLMDVLCLPTLREGLPNVCLEAGAMEIPVVTTTATGAVDSIADGETGLLVPPRDAAALARALRTLHEDPDRSRRMGAAGRRWVRAHFSRAQLWALHDQYLRRQLLAEGRHR